MILTIDTEKLNWIEIPGAPTLGSFYRTMRHASIAVRNQNRDTRYDLPPELAGRQIWSNTLCKVSSPDYRQEPEFRRFGYCPLGERIRVDFFSEFEHNAPGRHLSEEGPERILAVCFGLMGPLNDFLRELSK